MNKKKLLFVWSSLWTCVASCNTPHSVEQSQWQEAPAALQSIKMSAVLKKLHNEHAPPLNPTEWRAQDLTLHTQASVTQLKNWLTHVFQEPVVNRKRIYVGSFLVPLDYHNKVDTRQIELSYMIHYAKEHPQEKPTLWLNYGGPGYSTILDYATDSAVFDFMNKINQDYVHKIYQNAPYAYDHFHDFNVVLLGARMTLFSGLSDFMLKYEAASGSWIADETAPTTTIQRLGKYFGTNTMIQDMERLRRHLNQETPQRMALNTEQIHLYGMSYGALAFAYYTHQYPQHVASLIMDSIPDLTNSLPATKVKTIREFAGYSSDVPTQRTSTSIRNAFMYTNCSDQGYYLFHTVDVQTDAIQNLFYDAESCQDITPDPLASLMGSQTLKNLDFPVLLFSTKEDITTPLSIQQQMFNDVFNRQGIHIRYEGTLEPKHANLRSLLHFAPIRNQILNYLHHPKALLKHTPELEDGVCTYQTTNKESPEATACLPTATEPDL